MKVEKDDLIRRKDVLGLLIQEEHLECEDWKEYDDEASFGAMNACSRMRKLVELLPSAQPKRKPVIRCWCPKCGFEMIPTIDSEMKGEAGGE